jgi:peptidyl-prolyl cis-trans isomerase D
MLQAIRDRATGWLAWLIVIILIIPFAFWGLNEYLGGGSDVVVADVDGTEISRNQLNSEYDRLTRGERIDDSKEIAKVKRQVLDLMIQSEVLARVLADAGFRVPAALIERQIQAAPQFRSNGSFDKSLYQRFLSRLGMSHESFLDRQQRELVRRQFMASIASTEFVTRGELDDQVKLQDRKVDFSYIVIPAKRFGTDTKISDKAVSDYYQKHKADFVEPERIKLQYIRLDIAELMKKVSVTEDELKKLYEKHKRSYTRDPSRSLSHIMIKLAKDAKPKSVQAAMKKARDILARLRAGAKFEDVAKKESEDAGSATRGGKIGIIEKGSFGKAFDQAIAGLTPGDLSELVRTDYGIHIVRLDTIIPGKRMSFAEARKLIEVDYRREMAEKRFYALAEKLNDLSYDDPASLDATARELGLKVRVTDWITRQGSTEGLGSHKSIVRLAFSGDVFAKGDPKRSMNSKMVELKLRRKKLADPYVVVRLAAYQPKSQKPLKAVSTEIRILLRNKAMHAKAIALGNKILASLKSGKTVQDVSASHKLKAVSTGLIVRSSDKHKPELVVHAFRMGKPQKGKPVNDGVALENGDYAVLVLKQVKDGDPKKAPAIARQFMSLSMANLFSESVIKQFIEQIRSGAEVEINDKAIDKASTTQ